MSCTSAKGELRIVSHGIRLVENDELDARAEKPLRARKIFYLPPYYVDPSIVGGVQLLTGWMHRQR